MLFVKNYLPYCHDYFILNPSEGFTHIDEDSLTENDGEDLWGEEKKLETKTETEQNEKEERSNEKDEGNGDRNKEEELSNKDNAGGRKLG